MRHFFFLFVLLLTSCGQHTAVIPTLKPYRMDVQQGNVVTPKMMMQLRPGMTKSQVRFIMGTPLLTDPFHADRWDYFYQMRKEGRIIEQRRVILEFEADELKRVRGDVVPAGSDANAITTEPGKAEPRSIPPKKEEKSWVDKLKFWKQEEPAQSRPSQPKAAPDSMPQAPTEALPEEKPSGEALPAIAPAAEPAALPPLTAPEPALPAAPQPEAAPEKLKPAPAASQAQPGAKQKSVADVPAQDSPAPPKSAVKPQPEAAPKTKPAGKVAPKSEARTVPKTLPQPPEDLPPEEAPDFFEKMLEKIGF